MFDRFGDYMFFLLNAPLKKLKNGKNQLKIFFSVTGEVFDAMLEDIMKFRRQKMISTAEPLMLELTGRDRDMFRIQDETVEQYRRRLQMKAVIAELGGTNTGLLLSLEVLGYPECMVEPLYKTDRSRWAEIYIDILVTHDINYAAILYEVLKIKPARTLPYFRFFYQIQAEKVKTVAAAGIGNSIKIKARTAKKIGADVENKNTAALFLNQNIRVRADNSIKENEVYLLAGDGEKERVFAENGRIVKAARKEGG